jgi:hypothetical protein
MALLSTLSDIVSPSGRGALAFASLKKKSKLVSLLDKRSAFELGATSNLWKPTKVQDAMQTRAIDGAYSSDTTVSFADNVPDALRFIGGKLKWDNTYAADVKNGQNNINFDEQIGDIFNLFAENVDGKWMAGTGTSPDFIGLTKILNGTDDLPGFTGYKGVYGAEAQMSGTTPKSFNFLTATDKEIIRATNLWLSYCENPTDILMNQAVYSVYMALGFVKVAYTMEPNNVGSSLETLFGVPITVLNDTAIPNTETKLDGTVGATDKNTSMYITSLGEKSCSMITNSGLFYRDHDSVESKQAQVEEFEIRSNWRIRKKKSAVRINHLLAV